MGGRFSAFLAYMLTAGVFAGNLWQELWASARPVPAVKQAPLFDEELAG